MTNPINSYEYIESGKAKFKAKELEGAKIDLNYA